MPLFGTFGAFLLWKSMVCDTFPSVDSVLSFRRVGHGVGQTKNEQLLHAKFDML